MQNSPSRPALGTLQPPSVGAWKPGHIPHTCKNFGSMAVSERVMCKTCGTRTRILHAPVILHKRTLLPFFLFIQLGTAVPLYRWLGNITRRLRLCVAPHALVAPHEDAGQRTGRTMLYASTRHTLQQVQSKKSAASEIMGRTFGSKRCPHWCPHLHRHQRFGESLYKLCRSERVHPIPCLNATHAHGACEMSKKTSQS